MVLSYRKLYGLTCLLVLTACAGERTPTATEPYTAIPTPTRTPEPTRTSTHTYPPTPSVDLSVRLPRQAADSAVP
jgi:hypothetical protein